MSEIKTKFRKRAYTIWCPKPKTKTTYEDHVKVVKQCSKTGWTRMTDCEDCEFKVYMDENGTECSYGQSKEKTSRVGE